MTMRTIQLTHAHLMPDADELEGQHLDASHYVHLIDDSTTVLKPDGSLLLIYDSKRPCRSGSWRGPLRRFRSSPPIVGWPLGEVSDRERRTARVAARISHGLSRVEPSGSSIARAEVQIAE